MHPGSIASRAIEHLRTLKKGESCTSPVLAEAIDCESSSVAAVLAPYVKTGTVAIRKDGRNNCYSIGSGKPQREAGDEPPDHDEPRQRTVRATAGGAAETNGHASVFHAAGAVPHPSSWAQPTTPPKASKKTGLARLARPAVVAQPTRRSRVAVEVIAPAADTPPQPRSLTVGLFNTGELVIEVAKQLPVRLSREQTTELVDYLLRLDQLTSHNRL